MNMQGAIKLYTLYHRFDYQTMLLMNCLQFVLWSVFKSQSINCK